MSGPFAASLSRDFLEKRLGRRIAAEELVHHLAGGPLPSPCEDQLAEAPSDRRIHEVLPVGGQHVERENLRPHVAVVPGAVAADNVLEGSRKLRAGDMADRRLAFHADPLLHRIDLALAEKRHVVRRIEMLPSVLDATAEGMCGAQPLDQRLIDLRTSAAIPADQPQRLHLAPPLFVHLRRRFDKIAFNIGAAMTRVARPRQDSVQNMAELMQQRFQLAVIEAVAVEIGDQHTERRAPGEETGTADPESRGVAVLAISRKQIEVYAAEKGAGLAVDHVVVANRGMPLR